MNPGVCCQRYPSRSRHKIKGIHAIQKPLLKRLDIVPIGAASMSESHTHSSGRATKHCKVNWKGVGTGDMMQKSEETAEDRLNTFRQWVMDFFVATVPLTWPVFRMWWQECTTKHGFRSLFVRWSVVPQPGDECMRETKPPSSEQTSRSGSVRRNEPLRYTSKLTRTQLITYSTAKYWSKQINCSSLIDYTCNLNSNVSCE